MTSTPDMISTIPQALAAAEAAGLDPLSGPDHQFGTKYGVCLPGADRYINVYGDASFLAWINSYLSTETARRTARLAAGWELHRGIWHSPDGLTETEWALEENPFPEDPGFAEWFSAAYEYDARDADEPGLTEACAYPFD